MSVWRGWELYQKATLTGLPHLVVVLSYNVLVPCIPQGEFGGGQYVELDSTSSGVEASK